MAGKNTDAHGQPSIEFGRSNNREKLLNDLLGVCEGLIADSALTESEVSFLDTWLRESRGLLFDDPDVQDLQDLVQDILEDGVITSDELEDLQGLLDCIVRHRAGEHPFVSQDEAIQRLLGMARGLIADRQMSEGEVAYLQRWLGRCGAFIDSWPFSGVERRIAAILADGVVTAEEQDDLIEALAALVGGAFVDSGSAVGTSTRAFEIDGLHAESVTIDGNVFLLTGKFVLGPRRRCEDLIRGSGGLIAPSISKSVNYLVVGALSSRDWKHEAFGRKVEAAMRLREEGHPIAVVSEEHWVKFVPSLKG
jgi:NAD-dependent DNA ligase